MHALDLEVGEGPLDETTLRVPIESARHAAYDRAKAEGERRVLAAVADGLDAVVVQPTGVVGPFDFEPSHMGQVFLRLYRGTLPALVQGGFDFVDVRDVADGMIAAAERGRKGECYLLAGHYTQITELAALVAVITGRRHRRPTLPIWVARIGVPLLRLAAALTDAEPLYTSQSLDVLKAGRQVDGSKAQRELGYKPRPMVETVADIYRWFAAHGDLPTAASGGMPSSGEAGPGS